MTTLTDMLYAQEDTELSKIWDYMPFRLFNPNISFLGFGHVVRAILKKDETFFGSNIKNNFFPDKTIEEAVQAYGFAINRGTQSLNDMCQDNLPEAYPQLTIPMSRVPHTYDPLQQMTQAREKWVKARNGKHGALDPQPMFEAYNTVRAWGLGHFILMLDESPEVFHSVHFQKDVDKWFRQRLRFNNRDQISEHEYSWQTSAGVKVIGSNAPFRQRAKIYDDEGDIRYGSLLMKMFLKKGFMDKIHDSYGVELVVETEKDVETLIDYFRHTVKGTTALEKFQKLNYPGPPAFNCKKFIMRVPVRVDERLLPVQMPKNPKTETIKRPLEKYVRVPVEVQIRARQDTDHDAYKKIQYMKVFPLWYPKQIYEPILEGK